MSVLEGRRPRVLLAAALVAGLWLTALVLPLPYVVLSPGPTLDVLGERDGREFINATAPHYPTSGELLATTVNVTAPEQRLRLREVLQAWVRADQAVRPRRSVFGDAESTDEVMSGATAEFDRSERDAVLAGLAETGWTGSTDDPPVTLGSLGEVGGPSAGLLIALGVVDTLTPGSLTGGEIVAGTGTVSRTGEVGPIDGIQQKILGARAAGAGLFLVPADNCADALGADPGAMRLARADSLTDAVGVITDWVEDPEAALPSCS